MPRERDKIRSFVPYDYYSSSASSCDSRRLMERAQGWEIRMRGRDLRAFRIFHVLAEIGHCTKALPTKVMAPSPQKRVEIRFETGGLLRGEDNLWGADHVLNQLMIYPGVIYKEKVPPKKKAKKRGESITNRERENKVHFEQFSHFLFERESWMLTIFLK